MSKKVTETYSFRPNNTIELSSTPRSGSRITIDWQRTSSSKGRIVFTAGIAEDKNYTYGTVSYNGERVFTVNSTGVERAEFTYYTGHTYGFDDSKTKDETVGRDEIDYMVSKRTGEGKFVVYRGTTTLNRRVFKRVDFTPAEVKNIFGTDDSSKIHIVSTSMFRTAFTNGSGQSFKSWSNAYYKNTDYDGLTYTIPYIDLYPKGQGETDGVQMEMFLYNYNQVEQTETVTYRIVAYVED